MAKKKSEYKSRMFVIPKTHLSQFFQELEDNALDYDLVEVDEDGDLSLEVHYSSEERDDVMNLVELEDEFYKDEDENDNDDDEEEEDQDDDE